MKAENYRVRLLEANLYDTFRRVREFSNWNKKKRAAVDRHGGAVAVR